jgi:hypothetical protein
VDPLKLQGANRHAWLARQAKILAQGGLSEETIWTALDVEQRLRCDPPIESAELERIISGVDFAVSESGVRHATIKTFERQCDRRQQLEPISDQDIENWPAPAWLIDGVLPQEGTGVLYGETGCGKTFVALDMSFSVGIPVGAPCLEVAPAII